MLPACWQALGQCCTELVYIPSGWCVSLQRGMAALPELHVSDSSEAMLSGRKPPFRLLVQAVHRKGRKLNIRHAVSEGFVVSYSSDNPDWLDQICEGTHSVLLPAVWDLNQLCTALTVYRGCSANGVPSMPMMPRMLQHNHICCSYQSSLLILVAMDVRPCMSGELVGRAPRRLLHAKRYHLPCMPPAGGLLRMRTMSKLPQRQASSMCWPLVHAAVGHLAHVFSAKEACIACTLNMPAQCLQVTMRHTG